MSYECQSVHTAPFMDLPGLQFFGNELACHSRANTGRGVAMSYFVVPVCALLQNASNMPRDEVPNDLYHATNNGTMPLTNSTMPYNFG